MKPTLRKNGTVMVTLRVTHHLDFANLVALAVQEFDSEGNRHDDARWSRSKLLNKAKDKLGWGESGFISDGAFDDVTPEQRKAAEDFVDKLFPEMLRGEIKQKA